jgi:AraC-like DNA-binding protein/DNA gyrase inhibitor GyrI
MGTQIITQVIRTIESQIYQQLDNVDAEINVQSLASSHQLSRFQLARLFKKHAGQELNQFIQRMKLEAAANIVSYTKTPLLDLALNLGYTSQQAFTRAFTQYWGMSPGKMRIARQDYARALFDAQGRQHIQCQIRRTRTALKLWGIRYKGNAEDALQHWERFHTPLSQLLPDYQGPYYGLFYDDPAITPPGEVRYGCAVAMPAYAGLPPDGWYCIDVPPARFVVFQLQGTYAQSHTTVCPLIMHWFVSHQEQFGHAASFEVFTTRPSTDPNVSYALELAISLLDPPYE